MRYGRNGPGEQGCRGPMGCGKGSGEFGARWGQQDQSNLGIGQGSGRGFGLCRGQRAMSPGDAEVECRNLEMRAERIRRDLDLIHKRMGDLSAPEAAKD
jgi:hypothetical protein